jgi:hypothetical protein
LLVPALTTHITNCLGVIALLCLLLASACHAAGEPLPAWSFSHPGDLQGWQPNDHLAGVATTNGALVCRAAGTDPILTYQPRLELAASARQFVEIRLKANQSGMCEWFWGNSTTGRYGGFSQEKSLRFQVQGNSQWHTYRLLPCWQNEGKIVRLRLDLFDGAHFELQSIRLGELDSPTAQGSSEFDSLASTGGWHWFKTMGEAEQAAGKIPNHLTGCGTAFLLSPSLQVQAAKAGFVTLRFAVNAGHFGTLYWATDQRNGLQSRSFPIQPDGAEHLYNLDLEGFPGWEGTILALGIRPSDAADATAQRIRVQASARPQGAGEVRIASFRVEEALPRVGNTATVRAVLRNAGGEPATGLQALLELPPGLESAPGSARAQAVKPLKFDEETVVRWQVRANLPFADTVRLRLRANETERLSAEAPVRFTLKPQATLTGYVPEPKPVRGPYEVGAYYFPGWKTASQ